jgi:integrase
MLVNIKHKEVKVRRPNSHLFKGEDKFTGTVTYSVVGSVDRQPIRLSLGTEEKNAAIRRVKKLETACAEGPTSTLWLELEESLPLKTFKFFADRIGYIRSTPTRAARPTWANLCDAFELEMERLAENKRRGATKQTISENTCKRYRQVIRHFSAFLGDVNTLLSTINKSTIEMFKVARQKSIQNLKQARGGSSIALDIAILHRVFKFAVEKELMAQKPIDLKNESKPGANPQNGARDFTAEELGKLREAADLVNDGGKIRKRRTEWEKKLREGTGGDLFIFLVLRWTGLRGSDAVGLRWKDIHFDRGTNGEIQVLTQKRSKVAIIPLSTELKVALEEAHSKRKPRPDDPVLLNPENGEPFLSRKRLYERCKAMGVRAGVKRVTPHCFRDTFACDMLARGVDIYDVAKMLADTVDTVERHYAQFVPAARDAVQTRMDTGVGIEERAKLAQTRGQKVAVFPTRRTG